MISFEQLSLLTRNILRLANQGQPRFSFLQKMSQAMFHFSGCDAIELIHYDGNMKYHWQNINNSTGEHKFEILSRVEREVELGQLNSMSDIEQLCRMILEKKRPATNIYFTAQGTFWTNNLDALPDEFSACIYDATNSKLADWAQYQCLAIIPFDLETNISGVLVLKSSKRNFFSTLDLTLYERVAQTIGLASIDRLAQAALKERVKELTCLYGIARIAQNPEFNLSDKLSSIVKLLPPAWQHPDIAQASISVDDFRCVTEGYTDAVYRQVESIKVNGVPRGTVELIYIDNKPELEVIPFLDEEYHLIQEIAHQIGIIIENIEAREEKRTLQEQLRHADRLATIGQLAAGVAHELNEPLGSVLGFAQLAEKSISGLDQNETVDGIARDLQKIERASLHAREIIRKLLIFSRQMPTRKSGVDINRVIDDTIPFFTTRITNADIELIIEKAQGLPKIEVDPAQMNQLLINLVVNAIQAMPDGGTLTVKTDYDSTSLIITVSDTGTGMTEEILQQIFVPFFTTKDVDEGTGLGLSVVHGIVTSHGGTIKAESRQDEGTRFTIQLPLAAVETNKEG